MRGVAVWLCLAVSGCYCSHERPHDSGLDEARLDGGAEASRDANRDVWPTVDADECERHRLPSLRLRMPAPMQRSRG